MGMGRDLPHSTHYFLIFLEACLMYSRQDIPVTRAKRDSCLKANDDGKRGSVKPVGVLLWKMGCVNSACTSFGLAGSHIQQAIPKNHTLVSIVCIKRIVVGKTWAFVLFC